MVCVLFALPRRPVPGRDSGSSMASILIDPIDTLSNASPSDNRESRLPNQHNKTRSEASFKHTVNDTVFAPFKSGLDLMQSYGAICT